MHDSQIKSYCMWARRELISEVERKCAIFDIAEVPSAPSSADAVNGRVLTAVEKHQRGDLLAMVKRDGYEQTVEHAAYTWFNRIMAIRFMEVNDRLPSRSRMFSASDDSFKPQVLSEALTVDIEGIDRAEVARLVQKGDDEETFRYLFLAQCYELAKCMPDVFAPVGSTMEMLLPDGLLRPDGVIAKIVVDIDESDWIEGVEIVGWMYQYYVSEKKEAVDLAVKRGEKVKREGLAAKTQIFTPSWLVRYIVDNSLGHVWMLNHRESALSSKMDLFIEPDYENEDRFEVVESPEELKVLDPACGSGHILVYAFDLLASIYEEKGYARRDIPSLILSKNLFGLEIDPRATSIASFALTMKAMDFDSRFLRREIQPRVYTLTKVDIHDKELTCATHIAERAKLVDALIHLDECGSLFKPNPDDMKALQETIADLEKEPDLLNLSLCSKLKESLPALGVLAGSYDVVVANPPYLGSGNMNAWLKGWTSSNYPNTKRDLCTCFIERFYSLLKPCGYAGITATNVWMFITSYEKLRQRVIDTHSIISLVQLSVHGYKGIAAQVCAFTSGNAYIPDLVGRYIRLFDFDHHSLQEPKTLEAINNPSCDWFYKTDCSRFKKIPECPIAYWASDTVVSAYESCGLIRDHGRTSKGLITGDNDEHFRIWWEISYDEIFFKAENDDQARESGYVWFPLDKGGKYRRWYGNHEFVVRWIDGGKNIFNHARATGHHSQDYDDALKFKPHISWSDITSGRPAFRYRDNELSDHKGMPFYPYDKSISFYMGYLNSSVITAFLSFLSATMSFNIGELERLPVCPSNSKETQIEKLSDECVKISKRDWDSYENSWDFTTHPCVTYRSSCESIADAYEKWKEQCNSSFVTIQKNEEALNKIFAEIFEMEGEVPIAVPDEEITVRYVYDRPEDISDEMLAGGYAITKANSVSSFLSFAVGCMVGRYSLDVPGIIIGAQGEGLDEFLDKVPNPTFVPDSDGVIPFTDVEYFHDDATGYLIDILRNLYGNDTLERNLSFIAESIGGDGSSREVIRNYFRDRFFADHCATYSVQSAGKRPIYWLFDSGKKGGFRALFYMHRYTPDLLARLRTEYVHPQQERYRTQLERIDDAMQTADKREQATLRKEHKKISEQLAETNVYEEKVHHLADQMIAIDLDDGVNHNYALFQDVLAKIK